MANPKQSDIKRILTKVIGFVNDFDIEEESAKIVGLKGVPIEKLQGDIIISLGGDGTLLYIFSKLDVITLKKSFILSKIFKL